MKKGLRQHGNGLQLHAFSSSLELFLDEKRIATLKEWADCLPLQAVRIVP